MQLLQLTQYTLQTDAPRIGLKHTERGTTPVRALFGLVIVVCEGRIDEGIHRLPCTWQQFGHCPLIDRSLVRANGGTHQAINPSRGRWLDLSTPIPPEDGVLKMARMVIPRHDLLTQPRLDGLEVLGCRRAYPQCGAQAPPVAFPRPALPIVRRDDVGLDIELFRHVGEGRGRNISAGSRKGAFELEKLQGGRNSKATAGIVLRKEFELV